MARMHKLERIAIVMIVVHKNRDQPQFFKSFVLSTSFDKMLRRSSDLVIGK